jgi:1,4-alpha-glucan branching enzyme
VVVRALHPDAVRVRCLLEDGQTVDLPPTEFAGLFSGVIAGTSLPLRYQLCFEFLDGSSWTRDDPYRFPPTVGELDLHLFNEGRHRRLWERLGAHVRVVDGVEGTAFAVWAPNARRVGLVGDFCRWDGRHLPMRQLERSGVFELFVPGFVSGTVYKYEIKTHDGLLRLKTDPCAQFFEPPPHSAARVYESNYRWGDQDWMQRRALQDPRGQPMAVYEVHLGSWRRVPEDGHRPLTYREIAPLLVEHVQRFGFTHVELMPVAEHPFAGSWGYQVSGYYAPTCRYGTPDDFRFLVDTCHRAGIGVILDWVPAHFPKDDFALRLFDGTPLYEHADPRRGEHPDWDTLIFNYGRNEVRNFLLANALYWLSEFHIDGLRVDAVASMIYLDYSRAEGQWRPNEYGGKENLEALTFITTFNGWVREECPGCFTVAEESTSWNGVTRPVADGGLGFTFKWNMGWMHDTLLYFSRDPIHRRHHHNDITFASLYEHSEHFIMPLSHDEVVHGKGSLLAKMAGDEWQKFANLRLLLAYQYTRPGKKLLFMGTEIAPGGEWRYDASLDWHLAADAPRQGLARFLEALGRLYRRHPALWRGDADHSGFRWIHCDDHAQSVLSYAREAGADSLMVILNLTPVPRPEYRLGCPRPGRYRVILCGDLPEFGGSGHPFSARLEAQNVPFHGLPHSLVLTLPPLAALILEPDV